MENQELVFNTINTLKHPIALVQIKEQEYLLSYINESMKKILNYEESQELKTPDELVNLLNNIDSKSTKINDVKFFDKFYNIDITENSGYLLITFFKVDVKKLFENLSFSDIGDVCSAMIVVLNETGELIDTNECFLDFVGMKKKEILEKNFFQHFIPGNKELLEQHMKQLISDNSRSKHFITPLKNINKEIYRINWQVSKIIKENKNFLIAIGSDITTILEQNNTYKQELNSIKIGFEYFPFAVAYMNYKGTFTTINKKFMKMFHIKDANQKINFEQIAFFKEHIEFNTMLENIKLIKEVNYKITYPVQDKYFNFNVLIRMLSGKQESSKLFIVVIQKIKS